MTSVWALGCNKTVDADIADDVVGWVVVLYFSQAIIVNID
jgi:hypothetical protein